MLRTALGSQCTWRVSCQQANKKVSGRSLLLPEATVSRPLQQRGNAFPIRNWDIVITVYSGISPQWRVEH